MWQGGGQRLILNDSINSSPTHLSLPVRMGISLNLELIDSARLGGHSSLRNPDSASPMLALQDMSPHPSFLHGFYIPNYSLCAFISSTLLIFSMIVFLFKHSHIFSHPPLKVSYKTLPTSKKVLPATFQWMPPSNNHCLATAITA